MSLSKEEIQNLLKSPKNKPIIQRAVKHEQRLRFHVDTNLEPGDASGVLAEFLAFVKALLPPDKFKLFRVLFQFPIATNEITETIYESLEKVYDGKDAYKQHIFVNTDFEADYEDYRSNKLKADEFWRERAFDLSKVHVNGFIVVDMPSDQTTERPEPYFYFQPIAGASDFSYDKEGKVEWLFLEPDEKKDIEKKRLIVYDDERYRVFRIDKNKNIEGEAETDNEHFLGYCPVSFFWGERLKTDEPALKKSAISNQISRLFWYLLFETGKKHLDLFGPFPIYSGYEQDCDFENEENGDYCDGGFLKKADDTYYVSRDDTLKPCPVCHHRRLGGWGAFVDVPLPSQENNYTDLRNPVAMVPVDRGSLDYNVEEVERIKNSIIKAAAGIGAEDKMDKAYNKDQIRSVNEGRRNIIMSLKKNYERIEEWTDATLCRLRYRENFLGNKIFYGSDFYWYTADELTTQYDNAKKAGASDTRLDHILDQIIEVQNRGNASARTRALILKEVEPYRHQTRDEVLRMKSEGFGNMESIAIKLNFSTFVSRFERENTDLVTFGSALSFDRRIDIINNTLKKYAKDELIKQNPDTGQGVDS